MKTRIAKWSVTALIAIAAATIVGTEQAEAAGPYVSISLGRRLVRPATIVHPHVMPSPVVVAPTVVYDPYFHGVHPVRIGHPAYPYMLGVPTRSVVVRRTYVGPAYYGGFVGGTVLSRRGIVTRVGY